MLMLSVLSNATPTSHLGFILPASLALVLVV